MIGENYPDSCEEDEQKTDPEIKRRVIKAVDENGEFVSSTVIGRSKFLNRKFFKTLHEYLTK